MTLKLRYVKFEIPADQFDLPTGDVNSLPKRVGGIYKFYDNGGELLYVGKASDIRNRIKIHLSGMGAGNNTKGIHHNFQIVRGFFLDCPVERDLLETILINQLKPKLNNEKVWTYESQRWNDKYRSEEMSDDKEHFQQRVDRLLMGLNL